MSGMDAASSIPPLQAFSRLSADAFSRTSPTAQAALRRLGTYLETQSCNPAEVEAVRQWDRQRSTDNSTNFLQEAGLDVAALEHLVASRASDVRAALEQSRERAAILMGAASPTSTNGRPGAAPDGNRGPTTSIVEWWRLGSDNPWNFTLTTQETSPASCASCDYRLACLRDSIDLVEPFLSGMRCAAAMGVEDAVANTHTEGVSYVMNIGAGGEATSMFASLELARTYVTLSFRDRGGLAAVERAMQSCHALEDLRRLANLLERLDIKESNAQDTPQPQMTTDPAAGTLTRVQAYWSLAAAYAVFFHTVAAYLCGVSGNFEGFAAAVLGTADAPPDLPLWGAASFPFLSFVATESNASTAHRAETSSGTSRHPAQVHTRLAALFPSSFAHVTGGAADFYLADYRPLVTTVIAPAATFGTLLVLSAVATLPLPVVTQRLPLWVELRTLYEDNAELVALLLALRDGRLGAAWRLAKDAAAANLAREPHVSQSVLQGLLFAVQRALCFHYLSARGAADVAHAAQDLCFDSAEEFAAVATSLVCDGYIDARIDAVAGSIQLQSAAPAATTSDGGEAMSEAVGRAVLGLSALEMQLTCLSAERNLIFVPTNPDE